MNTCCEHNDVCRWGVGEFEGDEPLNHVEHFSFWLDAFEHFGILALERGVENKVLGAMIKGQPKDIALKGLTLSLFKMA